MSQPDERDLIDRHLAGVLTPGEVERLEHLIRTSPEWARRYREAEDLAQLLRKGLGDGAPAPDAVKRTIRRRATADPTPDHTPAWFARRRWIAAAVAAVLVAVGAFVLWPRSGTGPADVLTAGFPDEPLPFKDLARGADVAIEATTVMRDGRVRVRPDRVLFGDVGARGFAVPGDLASGHKIALFGRYDGSGMIRPLGDMRGIVHLDGVQRWEGKDRQPDESRALVESAVEQRSLAASLADLEAFLASDASRYGQRAGLVFSADVTARHLGAFEFEAIVQPLVKLVLNGNKHPDVRNAAAEGLERSSRSLACEVLLRSMAGQPMDKLQAESEDGQVVLGCLELLGRSGTPSLAPTLEKVAATLTAPALRQAAGAALAALKGNGNPAPAAPSVVAPVRFEIGGHECILMSGAQGRKRGLLVVLRGTEPVTAFRPVVNAAIAHGFGALVVPAAVGDLEACLDFCEKSGLVATDPCHLFSHWTAGYDPEKARVLLFSNRIEMLEPKGGPDELRTPAAVIEQTDLDAFFAR